MKSETTKTRLFDLLSLETLGDDRFRAAGSSGGWMSLYGGQLIAQALMAAMKTVAPERTVHSLHGYFLRAGLFDTPIEFEVQREREGRAFATRRITALQKEKPILSLIASFHRDEEGPDRNSIPMPDVPRPEDLERMEVQHSINDKVSLDETPMALVDIRTIDDGGSSGDRTSLPTGKMWMRIPGSRTADPLQRRALLVYISDFMLIRTALLPHLAQVTRQTQVTSLDHAFWIHEDFHPAEWHLFVQESIWAGKGRCHADGMIFSEDGRLVATVAQEGLIRFGAGQGDG